MKPIEAARTIISTLEKSSNILESQRRELLTGYITTLFPDYAWQIKELALGAEHAVKTTSTTTGRIDTRKGALLIEYKRNLANAKQREAAETKLLEYIAGTVNEEGIEAVSKCISTDVLRWRDYDVSITKPKRTGEVTPKDVLLALRAEYHFSKPDSDRFLTTVRRLLFEDVAIAATGRLLVDMFGLESEHYLEFKLALEDAWADSRTLPEAELGISLWSEYVENCFDKSAPPNEDTYLDHVYLVILARMIAASALSTPLEQAEDDFPTRCITGNFFSTGDRRVDRFVEEDFFRWVKDSGALLRLKPALTRLQNDLQRLDFRSAKKLVLLAELYEQIMPPERRAEFGAVYTPAWLVERITDSLPSCGELGLKVLDPACGTGTFLRSVIQKKLENIPSEWTAQQALESVLGDICGLDINPVSVIISKASVMLSLAEWLKRSDLPIEIPIYLCDSLFLPEGFVTEMETETITVSFDKSDIDFPSRLLAEGTSDFDLLVETADRLAVDLSSTKLSLEECKKALAKPVDRIGHDLELTDKQQESLLNGATVLVTELAKRIGDKRNRVWAFVLKNTYRPSLLKARFDFIFSNPPWLTISSFPAARYKNQLAGMIDKYGLTPYGPSRHHMEISTVFGVHCVAHYLKEAGSFAFILPRTIFRGDQHDPFRRSRFKKDSPLKVEHVWDLANVDPLFGRLACVIFGKLDRIDAGFPKALPCTELRGDPRANLIQEKKQPLILSIVADKSSLLTVDRHPKEARYYWDAFKQGADIMPRRAVIVDIESNRKAKVLSIHTSDAEKSNPNNKPPWDQIDRKGTVEREYVFTTLKSVSVLPFLAGSFSYAALPVEKQGERYQILQLGELAIRNDSHAKEWFEGVDEELLRLGNKRLVTWLKRKNKLVDQCTRSAPNLVLYGAGGTNICAAVADTTKTEFPFINDQTLYAWSSPTADEAWFVCGILNSDPINKAIKGYQPKGKFGEQHIHKLPLLFIPRYDNADPRHVELVHEARRIAKVAYGLARSDSRYLDKSRSLASRRKGFTHKLHGELEALDKLAGNIIETGEV